MPNILEGLRAANPTNKQSSSTGKMDKQAVLYLHKPGTQYACQDCNMFIPDKERCSIHHPTDVIHTYGSCGFFVLGKRMPDAHPMSNVTKLESGYTENTPGFSCKRCEYFLPGSNDCRKVDKNSPGDDPGQISPDACCNNWSALE